MRPMRPTIMRLRNLSILLVLALLAAGFAGCKKPSERRKERARLDSLRADSARPAFNPYKGMGRDNAQYNRERENLGSLDSLVTPQTGSRPSTTPRP